MREARHVGLAVMLVTGMALSACASGDRPGVFKDGETAHEPETIVQMGSNLNGGLFLPSKIAIDFEEAVRTGDGRLKVRVNLRNRTRRPMQVQVETIFKDAEWQPVGERTAWTLVRFGPKETRPYEVVSETAKPERYTVRIRSFN